MRQLLYISLYPPPPKPPKCVAHMDAPPPSPQKVQLQRQKDDLWPKPASRPLAIALLEAFAKTNTPESLMRGLPFHSYMDNDGVVDVNPFRREKPTDEHVEDHSPIRNEILAIHELKDCWGLLKNGFVKRKQADRYRMDEAVVNPGSEDDDIVGPHAWPVLEWLIHVFEQDEKRAGEEGRTPCSALLLCQIPAPRSKKGPRWDVEMPLKVAYACLSTHPRKTDRPHKYASPEMRIDLGMRLISLVSLTVVLAMILLISVNTAIEPDINKAASRRSIRSLTFDGPTPSSSSLPVSRSFSLRDSVEAYIIQNLIIGNLHFASKWYER